MADLGKRPITESTQNLLLCKSTAETDSPARSDQRAHWGGSGLRRSLPPVSNVITGTEGNGGIKVCAVIRTCRAWIPRANYSDVPDFPSCFTSAGHFLKGLAIVHTMIVREVFPLSSSQETVQTHTMKLLLNHHQFLLFPVYETYAASPRGVLITFVSLICLCQSPPINVKPWNFTSFLHFTFSSPFPIPGLFPSYSHLSVFLSWSTQFFPRWSVCFLAALTIIHSAPNGQCKPSHFPSLCWYFAFSTPIAKWQHKCGNVVFLWLITCSPCPPFRVHRTCLPQLRAHPRPTLSRPQALTPACPSAWSNTAHFGEFSAHMPLPLNSSHWPSRRGHVPILRTPQAAMW